MYTDCGEKSVKLILKWPLVAKMTKRRRGRGRSGVGNGRRSGESSVGRGGGGAGEGAAEAAWGKNDGGIREHPLRMLIEEGIICIIKNNRLLFAGKLLAG